MASTIKVDNVQNQPGTNIIDKCGTTITLGQSGDTIALACGASQTGFGRTGTVDWVTTIQTSTPFTAVSGKGYFINTTASVITVNLPTSPSVGDIVAVKDYAGTFATNNLTIGRVGYNMNGSAADSIRTTNYESLTLVYADATKGWIPVEEGSGFVGESYIVATGGTPCSGAVCGDYKIHTFTGPGSFTVCSTSGSPVNNLVSYLVVAGGAGGSLDNSGGGGGGGFREVKSPSTPYTASPLDGYPTPANRITVTATGYPITVGGGGAAVPGPASGRGVSGTSSIFSTITSAGGGYGGYNGCATAANGGSGGGAGIGPQPSTVAGGSGNTPPVTPPQGNNGGTADHTPGIGNGGGGGGGAGGVGGNFSPSASCNTSGPGGVGATTCISGSPVGYGGGGGGSGENASGPVTAGAASPCGTGTAGAASNTPSAAGAANKGGGTGGAYYPGPSSSSGTGGSGVVIIRYKFQ